MSNNIVINQENISKLTKRLKKSLDQNFNQKTPLYQAKNIFAQMLGKSSLHELQENLKTIKNNNIDNKNYIIEYGEYIESYLLIENCFFEKVSAPFFNNGDEYAIIDAKSYIDDKNTQVFQKLQDALTFMEPSKIIIKLYHKDKNFYQGICDFYYYYNKKNQIVYCSVNGHIQKIIV